MYYSPKRGQIVRTYNAFSLVEMLISLGLGALLLLFLAQLYVDLYQSQNKMRELIKLQQNSHQLLNYMQQHIQHIGYLGKDRENTNYEQFLVNNKPYHLANSQCFIFFYDLNRDGCIGSRVHNRCNENGGHQAKKIIDEFFGLKWAKNNLYYFTQKLDGCADESCKNWAKACNEQKSWKNSTDLVDYVVDNLAFKWKRLDELLEIKLTLRSIKSPDIKYSITAYSYLLNGKD